MPIDTRVPGRPDSVRGVAHWLRSSFGRTVAEAAGQLYRARNSADAGWRGAAGEAFRGRLTGGARKADELATGAQQAAQRLDDYAAGLNRVQEDMARIRAEAAVAGLRVDGDRVHEPDPGADPRQALAYRTAVAAAESARRAQKFVEDTLVNAWNDVRTKWFITVGDLVNGGVDGLRTAAASAMLRESGRLSDEAAKFTKLAAAGDGINSGLLYRDADTAAAFRQRAAELAKGGADTKVAAGRTGLKVGGALAAAGIVYDIAVTDKPVGQAVVSGAAGFAASVAAGAATGAAVGTLVPVPGVGTVAGAVVGAAVGVFTSGAIDSLYQNGIGAIGDAVEAGAQAVANTGKAIGDAVGDVFDAIF
ncbi:hypothetical protein [Crossiella sp. CA198]|uniref:hypothetical protein n=1 Tax=Crossiella sp. CA198 TaxID=3455607 RepID=UPI003F8D5EBB